MERQLEIPTLVSKVSGEENIETQNESVSVERPAEEDLDDEELIFEGEDLEAALQAEIQDLVEDEQKHEISKS